ncbi:hypothetical protein ACIPF8_01415 [Collimonas sp. NPDC087041]|uniref:hypothetical protein n=1 Tax=Collimonas sp. NPDC087041 TaxID=3363960 RepID=UPI0037F5A086
MNITKYISSIAAVVILAGCAHPMSVTPNVDSIKLTSTDQTIKKNVAYYIADDVRIKEVTTPGGGGDKVTYAPYRDMETAFYKMLSNVFASVTKLSKADDKDAIAKNKIDYVITPQLVTNSSSSSALTWPPTQFSVDMTCSVSDVNGNVLVAQKVEGQGHAEYAEFKKDFSLSGKRAMEDALMKMQTALIEAPALRQ